MANPRDKAGNAKKKKNGEPQKIKLETIRRRRRMVNPRNKAGNAKKKKKKNGEPQRLSWKRQEEEEW